MILLYRQPDNQCLALTNVDETNYNAEAGILVFFGDSDVCISVDAKTGEALVRKLFEEGKLDVTDYEAAMYEWSDDDDDDDDDDDEWDVDEDGNPVITIGGRRYTIDN